MANLAEGGSRGTPLSQEEYLQMLKSANNIAGGTGSAMGGMAAPASSGVTGAATEGAMLTGEAAGGTGNLGGVAAGAASGAAVGGPWGAVIGAALSLVQGAQQKKAAAKAQALADKSRKEDKAFALERDINETPGAANQREQAAIQQLLGVFQRTR